MKKQTWLGGILASLLTACSPSVQNEKAEGQIDVLPAFENLTELKVDGGACRNNFLMQFQSDVIGVPVERPACIETTALGAAYLAGLAVGFWPDLAALKANAGDISRFTPSIDGSARDAALAEWHQAVARVRTQR